MPTNPRKGRRAAAKSPSEPAEAATEPKTPEEPQQPNGVLVLRVPNEQGGLDFPVQVLGDVKVTEVQTILEKGIQAFRSQVGL